MVRNSVPTGRRGDGRRRLHSLLGAGGLGVLVVATAAACASSPKTAGAGSTGSAPVVVSSSSAAAPSASASSSGTGAMGGVNGGALPASSAPTSAAASASNHPMIPSTGGLVITPEAQVSTVPAGGKLVAFDSVARSKDGLTIYLGLESQGGACGKYDVVLEQASGTVGVGLVHLAPGRVMCPMYVTQMQVAAKLSAPLGSRTVQDLVNGQVTQVTAVMS
jgi:hypothetical protein